MCVCVYAEGGSSQVCRTIDDVAVGFGNISLSWVSLFADFKINYIEDIYGDDI